MILNPLCHSARCHSARCHSAQPSPAQLPRPAREASMCEAAFSAPKRSATVRPLGVRYQSLPLCAPAQVAELLVGHRAPLTKWLGIPGCSASKSSHQCTSRQFTLSCSCLPYLTTESSSTLLSPPNSQPNPPICSVPPAQMLPRPSSTLSSTCPFFSLPSAPTVSCLAALLRGVLIIG